MSNLIAAQRPSLYGLPGRERGIVASVFTKCPVTGQPIETGVEIDEASFARLPSFIGRVFCRHCSSEHEWGKDAAWVVEHGKPST